MYGGIWTPPSSDKAFFLSVVYVQRASNIIQHMGASKHMGDVQAYRGHPNIGDTLTYRGI